MTIMSDVIQKIRDQKGISEEKLFSLLYKEATKNNKLMYMGLLLQRAAREFGNKIALIGQESNRQRSITYSELYARAVALSKKLIERGIKPKDRVPLFFENSIEFYIGYFAIVQVGAVVAPLNTFLHDRELQHIMKDSQPTCMIVSDACAQRLRELGLNDLPLITRADMDFDAPADMNVDDFKVIELDSDEMVVLLYTSGTTGLPKGVMLSSKNIMTNVIQGIARVGFGLHEDERIFGILPLFHSFAQFACVWAPLFVGATVIVVPKIDRRSILSGLAYRPTIFLGVPALYGLLCLMRSAQLDSVRYFVSGGDALPDKIRAAFALIYRRKICSGYGLTETSPLISVDFSGELAPTSMVGPLVMGMEGVLKDEAGNEVLKGEIGELWVKGDNVMLGYYNAPEMTKQVLQDGWFCTGDLAYFDEKNNIVITGRLKDLIIHKGLNIYPQEIENVILAHAAVIRAGVIGKRVGDEEVPVAYVQLREEVPNIEKELKELCKKNLATYKIPRSFLCTTKELQTTATGKVNKKVLRKQNNGLV